MRNFWISLLAFMVITSCNEEVIEFTPTEKFNSIFDNPVENIHYEPLDIIETDEGGFLILSKLVNGSIFVLKANSRGDFLWSEEVESDFINPVAKLIRQGDNYYFVAGRLPDQTATLFEINDLQQTVEARRSYEAYRRPLAFNNLTPDTYLLLTYNDTTGTVLSKIQDGFAMEWARNYDEIDNAHQKLDAFQNSSKNNFFVGAYNAGSVIFFNSLREEGLKLTFANDQGIATGIINASDGDFINTFTSYDNALLSINYLFNDQAFFLNAYQPAPNARVDLELLNGDPVQDRLIIQNVTTAPITVGTTNYLLNAYSTLDGRIKMNFYASSSGEQKAIKYVGGIDPLEVVKIIQTRDEGIAILSKITIAGTKERIKLSKIPRNEILEIL